MNYHLIPLNKLWRESSLHSHGQNYWHISPVFHQHMYFLGAVNQKHSNSALDNIIDTLDLLFDGSAFGL